jgi:hypothetical protein
LNQQLLVEEIISEENWLELEAKNKYQPETLQAEEEQLIEDKQSDLVEIIGAVQMIKDQAQFLAEGGSEQDFLGKVDWDFYFEAMDLKAESSPARRSWEKGQLSIYDCGSFGSFFP